MQAIARDMETVSVKGVERTRVVLLHARRMMREALIQLLSSRAEIQLVGAFSGARELLEEAPEGELVIIHDRETVMRDGPELLMELKQRLPDARHLHINVPDDDKEIVNCVRTGCSGCILDGASTDDVMMAIRSVAQGEIPTSPKVMTSLFSYVASLQSGEDSIPLSALTRREEQVLQLLDLGFSNKEIARELFLQPQTVKNYVRTIFEKLGVRSRLELIRNSRTPRR